MKKMKAGLVAAAILASFSGAALAEGSFYGAVDVGKSTFKGACEGTWPGETCKDTDTALRGIIGYQVNPNLAVEASYANYGAAEYNDNAGLTASASATGFQLSAVGSWPIANAFSLTGKLGLALTKGEVKAAETTPGIEFTYSNDDDTTALAWGIGARYDINQSVAVRAQYERLGKISFDKTDSTATSPLNLLTAGVIFRF